MTGGAENVIVPALLVAPSASVAVKANDCRPVKPGVGVKRAVKPSGSSETVPPTGALTA